MKRFVTSLAVGITMMGSLVVFATTNASAAGATIQATPNTALANGQTVMVSGSGFVPNETIYVIECVAGSQTSATCDLNSAAGPFTTDASGNLASSPFKVVTGTVVGNVTCGTSASDLSNCEISAGTIAGTDTTTTPITFALPTTTTTTTVPKVYHPHVSVAPSRSLKNGQKVRVSGHGFKPGDHVYIVECLSSVTGSAQCDLATTKPETITAGGVLPTANFKVLTGKIGTGKCGTKASNLKGCVISVGNAAKGDATKAPIWFALKK